MRQNVWSNYGQSYDTPGSPQLIIPQPPPQPEPNIIFPGIYKSMNTFFLLQFFMIMIILYIFQEKSTILGLTEIVQVQVPVEGIIMGMRLITMVPIYLKMGLDLGIMTTQDKRAALEFAFMPRNVHL